MTKYVSIPRLNGRGDFFNLSISLHRLGIEAEYNPGGWNDRLLGTVVPHLRFELDEDATAFAMYTGRLVHSEIPTNIKQEYER